MPDTTGDVKPTGEVSEVIHDSNHVQLTNIAPYNGDTNILPEGMSLSEALSLILYKLGTIANTADGLEGKFVENLEKFKNDSGKGFSTNDFTDEDKAAIAKLKDQIAKVIDEIENPNHYEIVDPRIRDTNHVQLTNIAPFEGDVNNIPEGMTLSEALSLILYKLGTVSNTTDGLKDEFIKNLQNFKDETGKGFSSNDFTDEDKAKIAKIEEELSKLIDEDTDDGEYEVVDPRFRDTNHVRITNIAPYDGDLNNIPEGITLSEVLSIIFYYLGQIDNKVQSVVDGDIRDKVDKLTAPEEGMGYSHNDFTDEDKEALAHVTKELESRSLLETDSNHVTVTNIQTVAKGEIEHGDSLSTALSKLQYMFGILHFKLKDEYLDKGQINKEYVHRKTGMGLSTNDFDDDYKKILDNIGKDTYDNPTYTKAYIDRNFARKDGDKGLSTNDFTDEYRDNLIKVTKKLDDNYLSLLGGNMTNHRITFEVGGGIDFNGTDKSVETTLDKDFYTGTAYKAIRVGNMVAIERSKEYNVGDTVFTENMQIGLYLYCSKAGTTAVLEPEWNQNPGGISVDGTTEWTTRRFSSLYADDGQEIKTEYLGSNGGAMNGNIDLNSHNLEFTKGGVTFDNGVTLTKDGLKGNADTATALQLPFKINGFSVDGTEDIELDYIPKDEKSRPHGVATLDAHGRVPVNQLPSFVRSVENVDDYDSLPNIGDKEIIYVTDDNNEIYRWSGTKYINVSPSSSTSEETIKLAQARAINLGGVLTGSAYFDGSEDITIDAELNSLIIGGDFGNTGSFVPSITIGDDGRITAVKNRKVEVPFSEITNKPTTLEGYGITNAMNLNDMNKLADIYLALAGGRMTGNIVMSDNTQIASLNANLAIKYNPDNIVIGNSLIDAFSISDTDKYSNINSSDYTFGFMSAFRSTNIETFRQASYSRTKDLTLTLPFNTFDVFKGAELKNENNATAMSIGFGQDKTTAIFQISPSNKKVRVGGGTNVTVDWKDTVPTCAADNEFTGKNTFTGRVELSDDTKLGEKNLRDMINGAVDAKVLVNAIYPVGSIYMTTDENFDPNVEFAGSTWEQADATDNISFGGSTAKVYRWRREL